MQSFLQERDWAEGVRAAQRRWSALSFSATVHAAIVAALLWPATAMVLTPRLVARGEGGNARAAESVALYLPADWQTADLQRPTRSATQRPALVMPREATKEKLTQGKPRKNALTVEHPSGTLAPGSPTGSSYAGLSSGDEVRPALPAVYPEPIRREELPVGLHGDVIVEVTIDAQGAVIEAKLLQGVGHGIDERVIAALHDWRFRPATRNGAPIPSKHDVHFHFPS